MNTLFIMKRTLLFVMALLVSASVSFAADPFNPNFSKLKAAYLSQAGGCDNPIASGVFGANDALSWQLCENGTLTISGEGAMPDVFPWYNFKTSISKLVISEGVTTIGYNAFNGCSGLTGDLIIPNSVTSIGDQAFANCNNLQSVTIPNSVTSIVQYAFDNCYGLQNVTVQWQTPLSVSGNNFSGLSLSNLTLTVPAGTKALYEAAPVWQDFGTIVETGNALQKLYVPGQHQGWNPATASIVYSTNLDGIFDGYAYMTAGNEFKFTSAPDWNHVNYGYGGGGTLSIDDLATNLTVSADGFYRLTVDLSEEPYTYSATATDWGLIGSATAGGWDVSTPMVLNTATGEWTVTATLTGGEAFKFRANDAWDINLGDDMNNLTYDGSDIPVISTGTYLITLKLGDASAYTCTLTEAGGNSCDIPIASGVFGENDALSWKLCGDGTLTISGEGAMPDYTNATSSLRPWDSYLALLKSLIIEEGITSIGAYSFNDCSSLTGELVIPNSITTINRLAFQRCSGLTGLSLGNSLTSIGTAAFNQCGGLTGDLVIPNSVAVIDSSAFQACSGLTGLSLGNSLTSIGFFAFNVCEGLTGNLVIPNSVTSIDRMAFQGCSGLTGLSFGNSVTSIGDNAFAECSGLQSVTVQWQTPLTVPNGVFLNVPLNNLTVPAGTKALYEVTPVWKDFGTIIETGSISIFEVDGIRYRVIAGTQVEVVAKDSPAEYSGRIFIPASVNYSGVTYSVTKIGDAAFKDCITLFYVSIPEGVTSLGNEAFWGVPTSSLFVPESVTDIGIGALNVGGEISVAWTTPPAISIYVASVGAGYVRTPLRVPVGTKALYDAADMWGMVTEYETEAPLGDYFTDFNNNTFDTSVWNRPRDSENDIRVEDGMMKIEQNVTDKPTSILSRSFGFENDELEVSRKLSLTPGGDYYYASINFWFDNGYAFSISYLNTLFYNGGYKSTMLRGIYFYDIGVEESRIHLGDYENDVFFDEKFVLNKTTGLLKYYVNDELRGEITLDAEKMEDIHSFRLRVESYGWYTGHKQYFDDLSVKTGGGSSNDYIISFDFNDNVWDADFWRKDLGNNNQNDIRVEDGMMKVEQNQMDVRTNLVSKELFFGNSITLERDVYLHNANDNYFCGITFVFNNNSAIGVEYSHHNYAAIYGTYLNFGTDTIITNIGLGYDLIGKIQISPTVIFDDWFHEKIIINRNGDIQYYIDGTLLGEYSVDSLIWDANAFNMRFSPYGWNTEHKHYFDNFLVKISGGESSDCENPLASGLFGENDALSWKLCPDGTLTISGEGAMPDYQWEALELRPWDSYQNQLKRLVIEEGITSIGAYSLSQYGNLTGELILPHSVTSIGMMAFAQSGITSVTIPENVTFIGSNAFWDCASLTAVYFNAVNCQTIGYYDDVDYEWWPAFWGDDALNTLIIGDKVTNIPDFAFCGSGLQTVSIPDQVTHIGFSAFSSCDQLSAINVATANPYFSSENGVLFNKNKTTLLQCPAGKTGEYLIPAATDSIADYAFYGCGGLTGIIIPNHTKSIGLLAFELAGITELTIPESITFIGRYAFYDCSALETVHFNADNCTDMGYDGEMYIYPVFAQCESLQTVNIGANVQTIPIGAFAACYYITAVTNHRAVPQEIRVSVFQSTDKSNATLTVPFGSKALYEAALVWQDFGTIIEMEESTDFVIFSTEVRDASEYTAGHTGILFYSNNYATAQLSGIPAGGLTVNGNVQVIKTFEVNKWYPVGFPFEIESVSITQSGTVTPGIIYNEDNDSETPDNIGNATDDNYFVMYYDGDGNTFRFTDTMEANKGYIVEFPGDPFSAGSMVTVTFTSVSNPVLYSGNGAVGAYDASGYTLVVNPNVANTDTLSAARYYYQYVYDYNHFGLVGGSDHPAPALTEALKPFEAVVAYSGLPSALLRATIGTGDLSNIPTIVANDPITDTRYYTLLGQLVAEPVSGRIYIVQTLYQSGKSVTQKMYYIQK